MAQLNIERVVLEKLLHNAAAASRLIGHLDDNVGGAVVGPVADSVDELVHTLSELLGDPEVVVASVPDACFAFPEGLDDAQGPGVLLGTEVTVARSNPGVGRARLLVRSLCAGERAVRVSAGTTFIALVMLALVAAAVIGGAP